MFSVQQKRDISTKIQQILRKTNHPELPDSEISFNLHVEGADPSWSWADIRNNGACLSPKFNVHNENQAMKCKKMDKATNMNALKVYSVIRTYGRKQLLDIVVAKDLNQVYELMSWSKKDKPPLEIWQIPITNPACVFARHLADT